MTHPGNMLSRRRFVGGVAAAGLACSSLFERVANAATDVGSLLIRPPKGFVPLSIPGKVVKASGKADFAELMQPNQIWPKPEVARRYLERAMTELTGERDLVASMRRFISPADVVAIKPNGIAGNAMSTSFELILPVVEACVAIGVPPEKITVYEQYPSYLLSTRVGAPKYKLPSGVRTETHNNKDCTMPGVAIYEGISTKYCRQFTEATAVITMGLFKDHSICGYTGALKNTTHGNINNPEAHHAHYANPQIAMLYGHPIVTRRVRLHIADVFKLMYDRGPLLKDPNTVVPHGAVYVSTDPVALDTIGWIEVDKERKRHGRRILSESGRAPTYIETASDLGLGVRDVNRLRLREIQA